MVTRKGPSWKGQAIMAGTLCVLGAFAYWLEYNHRPKQEAADEQKKKIFALKSTSVASISVKGPHGTVTLGCLDLASNGCKPGDTAKWEIASAQVNGKSLKADDSNVNSFLSSLNSLEPSETIDLKDETPEKRAALLKEYGLDPASLEKDFSVRVLPKGPAKEGDETTLLFGLTHPVGEGIFAVAMKGKAVDESKVYLIPTYFKSNWEHDLTHWRDKKVMPSVQAHDIAAFKLDGSKAKLTAERKAGAWTLHAKGEDYAGDLENIDTLLSGLTFLTAKDFPSKSALEGTKPVISMTLTTEKKAAPSPVPSGQPAAAESEPEPITIVFHQRGGAAPKKGMVAPGPIKLYATVTGGGADPSTVFELEPYSKDRFDKDVKDLRMSKLITSVEKFTAKKLVFSGKTLGTQLLPLVNSGGKWQREGGGLINVDRVQRLLDKLSSSRVTDFTTQIPQGQDSGLTMVFSDDKAEEKHKILFWRDSGKLYGRDLLSARKEAMLLDPGISDALPWDLDFFKPGPPPAAPSGTPDARPKGHF